MTTLPRAPQVGAGCRAAQLQLVGAAAAAFRGVRHCMAGSCLPQAARVCHGIPLTPASLPCPACPSIPGYMLLPAHRSELAAALNRAILVHSGRSEDSALEAILRQATAALQVGAGQAAWGGGGVLSGWLPCSQALLTLRLVQHGELLVLWPTAPAFIFCCTQCAGVEAKRAPRGAAAGCADAAAAAAGAAAAGSTLTGGSSALACAAVQWQMQQLQTELAGGNAGAAHFCLSLACQCALAQVASAILLPVTRCTLAIVTSRHKERSSVKQDNRHGSLQPSNRQGTRWLQMPAFI